MNEQRLKELLESGAITNDECTEMLSEVRQREEDIQKPEEVTEPTDNTLDDEKLEKLIQSKVDKATANLGKDKAALQKQLETLKREKLTDEERKQLEIADKEKEIADREKSLLDKENRLYAIKAIKKHGLDDGSDTSLELIDFVMAENETDIDVKIKAFKNLVEKFVSAQVDKTFKQNGRQPEKGGVNAGVKNPYAKDTFNLSEQMNIELLTPELAAQLKAAAGV